MNSRDEYVSKMQAKLEEWNTEINMLTARADKVGAELKNEYHEQIESLKVMQAAARQKLEVLQQAGENAWKDLKSGIEQSWNSMGETVKLAKSRFR